MDIGAATEYIFLAAETWFCIREILLPQVGAIQIYCIEKGEKINPRNMNTDVVEWLFGDGRQMVGGNANKITLRQWGHASFKAGAFSAGQHGVVDNNRTVNTRSKRHQVFWKQSKIKCNV